MCVAIHAPKDGKLIPYEDFELMRVMNDDGMGLMWAEDGKLKIVRQLRRLRRFWKKYEALHAAGKDVVIHFRMGTHGDNTMRNVHPVHVNSRLALVHNGILEGFSSKDLRSDTRQFVDCILKHLPNDWYLKDDGPIWETVSSLTTGSKMIFMDHNGTVKIMHQAAGWWKDGNWFSTMSWKHYSAYSGYTGYIYRDVQDFIKGLDSTSAKNHDTQLRRWNGETASGAYLHCLTSEVVCERCRKMFYDDVPKFHFQTLWDDGEPIVCDCCDLCVNQQTLIKLYSQRELDDEDEKLAESGIGATVMGG